MARRQALLRRWGAGAVGVFAIAAFVPIHTAFGEPAHSLVSDNRTTDFMIAILIGLPAVGLYGARGETSRGLSVGAVAAASTWALAAVAVTVLEIRVPATSGDPLLMERGQEALRDPSLAGAPAPYLGFYLMVIAFAAGVGFVASSVVVSLRTPRQPRLMGCEWLLGLACSALVTLSLMLPPHPDGPSFVERNFDTGYAPVTIAWLVLVSGVGGASALGFVHRGRWGLGIVLAWATCAAWLAVIAALGLDTPNEPGPTLLKSAEVHPIFFVALVGQAVALAPALIRLVRQHGRLKAVVSRAMG